MIQPPIWQGRHVSWVVFMRNLWSTQPLDPWNWGNFPGDHKTRKARLQAQTYWDDKWWYEGIPKIGVPPKSSKIRSFSDWKNNVFLGTLYHFKENWWKLYVMNVSCWQSFTYFMWCPPPFSPFFTIELYQITTVRQLGGRFLRQRSTIRTSLRRALSWWVVNSSSSSARRRAVQFPLKKNGGLKNRHISVDWIPIRKSRFNHLFSQTIMPSIPGNLGVSRLERAW